ncbi:hypothetical protein F0U44_04515 [Nocardioides humilatus]|uniref:WXG100 family type VII secretion target n=1 Tax=Nocardioides humilatus TaxID=2607660 RepID=A0A5B1LLB2_9ACTN|nr:WXG100 family type VII secretion target [Nocardioides humilatus]KAA1421555.1 hypothetical protein F0U44_04515 [Nocardioides humilatus]
MTFVGMDLDQVRAHADGLGVEAQRLESLIQQVDAAVDQAGWAWPGPDADAFRDAWFSSYRSSLNAAAVQLGDAVMVLYRQIEEQALASGEPVPGGSFSIGGFSWTVGPDGSGFPSISDLLLAGFSGFEIGTSIASFVGDFAETWKDAWKLENFPGGKWLGNGLKGIGLGFALSDLYAAGQRGDLAGGVKSALDVGMTVASAPLSLLWTGLSTEVGFFLPLNSQEADNLYSYMQNNRGLTPEQINERWSGWQGFINYGNDNVARKAPWLVEGADKLMEKPAEWLYNMGIKL